MRKLAIATLFVFPLLSACAGRTPFPTVDDLELDTVVLYRNGIGYFERRGKVNDDVLRLKVRKDQVNDLLKSLTVVDTKGKAVSVSMPRMHRSRPTNAAHCSSWACSAINASRRSRRASSTSWQARYSPSTTLASGSPTSMDPSHAA